MDDCEYDIMACARSRAFSVLVSCFVRQPGADAAGRPGWLRPGRGEVRWNIPAC